ncbi:GTPase-activating protein GYP7 [Aspergillus nidulans FGSC A4]|uniref:GTPase-activating protein GYP7 n=1 Tax=Emericella nidulans (strain FGSC A4 / ATCC 38163 / CBS 112.46 / NRRL 194 / M139) TaxID=227321 RepID=C8V155_EMENI|nr:GTPase-activating protein GYP7 [Aspergillus nidulans FGSC A4]CBF71108.1 TPA: GTPase activating protein (Gyp7), putative (AFU_orthologue; AFUA_6G03940) [Aspergillus nidulans FGSC A4]
MTSSNVQFTPPPSPPSPTASFFDVSDEEEDEYNTIAHSTPKKGVRLLFSKSKVYVHPTPSAKDNIPGFIALVQQKPLPSTQKTTSSNSNASRPDLSSFLLAWVPESALGDAYDTYVKVDLSEDDSPPRQRYLVPPLPETTTFKDPIGLYAFAVPLSQIYSLLVRPPSLGWWFGSLVINTRAGDSFPALFFHDSECQSTILQKKKRARETFDPFDEDGSVFWGGDEVLRWLRKYVDVQRSTVDHTVYLINPSEEDQLSFGKPQLTEAAGSQDKPSPRKNESAPHDAGMDPFMKAIKETRWRVLEQLSKITTFTRRTANEIAENPRIPPQVRRLLKTPEIQTLQEEFDSARIYLARWAMSISEQSERERNRRIWTARDTLEMENSAVGDFEILEAEMGNMALQERRKVVTLKEWQGFFDQQTGRLQVTVDEVKERIFHGGLDPNDGVRKEAWLFLLEVYPWDSDSEDRQALMNSRRDEYIRLKGAWWERMVEGDSTPKQQEWWKEQRNRIEKDVHRTDRTIPLFAGEDIPHPDPDSPFADVGTNVHLEQMKDMLLTYNEYNPDLGYVQGMSDLLAPIYAVMQDDAVAFWAFANFMNRMERNFLRDQSGMRAQLLTLDHLVQLMDPQLYLHLQSADSTNFFFFFRMLLVWYKREFEWVDVLRLWETLWTDYLTSNFHLFIALAILEKHRDVIMDHLKQFDEVLKYINELSNTMDLIPILTRAETLFHRFGRQIEAIDKKNNFPTPPGQPQAQRPTPAQPQSSKGKSPERQLAASTGVSSSTQAGPGSKPEAAKIIPQELRDLFRKDVFWNGNSQHSNSKP